MFEFYHLYSAYAKSHAPLLASLAQCAPVASNSITNEVVYGGEGFTCTGSFSLLQEGRPLLPFLEQAWHSAEMPYLLF